MRVGLSQMLAGSLVRVGLQMQGAQQAQPRWSGASGQVGSLDPAHILSAGWLVYSSTHRQFVHVAGSALCCWSFLLVTHAAF